MYQSRLSSGHIAVPFLCEMYVSGHGIDMVWSVCQVWWPAVLGLSSSMTLPWPPTPFMAFFTASAALSKLYLTPIYQNLLLCSCCLCLQVINHRLCKHRSWAVRIITCLINDSIDSNCRSFVCCKLTCMRWLDGPICKELHHLFKNLLACLIAGEALQPLHIGTSNKCAPNVIFTE